MHCFNVVLLIAAVSGNVVMQHSFMEKASSENPAAIGEIAGKLPVGFGIDDADADANGSVTWKELYDTLATFSIPNLDTGVVKGLVAKFAVDGPKEGAEAGLDKAEFTKMIAYLKKKSADALIPKNPNAFDTGCYNERDKGQKYRGLLTSTASGRTCQKWLDDKPHEVGIKPDKKNGLGNHNFCRNPDKSEEKPWCFTQDPTSEKEVCEVPICGKMERNFPEESDVMAEKIAAGLECDCVDQLYGSTTTTASTAVALMQAALKKKYSEAVLEAAKARCSCPKGEIAVLKAKKLKHTRH